MKSTEEFKAEVVGIAMDAYNQGGRDALESAAVAFEALNMPQLADLLRKMRDEIK